MKLDERIYTSIEKTNYEEFKYGSIVLEVSNNIETPRAYEIFKKYEKVIYLIRKLSDYVELSGISEHDEKIIVEFGDNQMFKTYYVFDKESKVL